MPEQVLRPKARQVCELLRRAEVGGSFWAARPALPTGRTLLLAPSDSAQKYEMRMRAHGTGRDDQAIVLRAGRDMDVSPLPAIAGPCDPWHLAAQAGEIWVDADNDLALVAVIAGCRVRTFGSGRFARVADSEADLLDALAAELGGENRWLDPFTGEATSVESAIALLAQWRTLIDANRESAAIFGVAGWKRTTLDPLLWDGSGASRHASRLPAGLAGGARVLAWKSRTPPAVLRQLETQGVTVGEIEDGFIRSTGLGANCVPPLSAIVDVSGVYFDPRQPSDLETILATADISPQLAARARALQQRMVETGISKYAVAPPDLQAAQRPPASGLPGSNPQRRVLVTGQVEDDRSIECGGQGCTNMDLIRRVRVLEPDAWVLYKPHPDVEAGHRKGSIPDDDVLLHANEIERTAPISQLIDSVDAVHVITSLAGFEALLRGKHVTTHGVPFYAGWGLTRDVGVVPDRRGRRRTLDELVAATLILYPRYVDPVTRLPCPPEIVVERMAAGQARVTSPLIRLRELQGQLNLFVRRLLPSRNSQKGAP